MAHTTQGAPAPAAAQAQLPQELIIITSPNSYGGTSEYIGTAAQLQAEGIVHPSVGWPLDGWGKVRWEDAHLRYSLCRIRPPGAKGHRSQWAGVDCWKVTATPRHITDAFTARVRQKAAELAEALWQASPQGCAAAERRFHAVRLARRDQAFQQFMSGVLPAKGVRHV